MEGCRISFKGRSQNCQQQTSQLSGTHTLRPILTLAQAASSSLTILSVWVISMSISISSASLFLLCELSLILPFGLPL
jgi:hypothetical protein